MHVLFTLHNSCQGVVYTPSFLNVKCICKHKIYIPWLTVGFYCYVNSTQLNYFRSCNTFCVYAYNPLLSWNITSNSFVIIHLNVSYIAKSQYEILDQRYLHKKIIHIPGNWFDLNYVTNTELILHGIRILINMGPGSFLVQW